MTEYDELINILDNKATEEFKGVLEYDEIVEKMKGPEHEKHIAELRDIQEDQAVHVLRLASILSDMGKEASVIQKLEDFFGIEDKKY